MPKQPIYVVWPYDVPYDDSSKDGAEMRERMSVAAGLVATATGRSVHVSIPGDAVYDDLVSVLP